MGRRFYDEIKEDKLNCKPQIAQASYEHNHSKSDDLAVEGVRAPNIAQRVREEFEAIQHALHEMHDKGHTNQKTKKRSLSESTDVMDVKAPDIFQRVKEEVEAVAETLHEKHEKTSQQNGHDDNTTTGCWTHMGRAFEKFCGGKGI
ncbi:hypothetical protein GOP47_0029955 [Adiantum capillus-veneris]|nr:hypothetical protein GOP47_0029955 [Adiantum capillus-veneris]